VSAARPAANPPTTATTHPVAPTPAVVDRGDDVVAVARSQLLFGRWLEAKHPDPALVDHAFAWGSRIERGVRADVAFLHRSGRRIVEVDRAPFELVVVSRLPNVVSLRVVEHLGRRDLVDARGSVIDHVPARTERYVVLIRRGAAADAWRISAVERIGPPIEVQL
jgi:hypothetical protein